MLTEEACEKEDSLLKGLLVAGFVIASSDSTRDNFKIVTAGLGIKYEIMGHHLNVSDSLRRRIMTEVPSRFFEIVEMMSFRCHDFPATSPLSV